MALNKSGEWFVVVEKAVEAPYFGTIDSSRCNKCASYTGSMGRDFCILRADSDSVTRRTKRRDFLELVIAYGLVLTVLWAPHPWHLALWGIAAAATSAIMLISADGRRPAGFRPVSRRESLWAVLFAIMASAAAIGLAYRFHTLHLPATTLLFVQHYGAYAVWAFVQEIILQCFLLSRLLRLLPDPRLAALAAALLFAGAHLPSPILTGITLVCGLAACLTFLRYRNLYTLAVAHALLGIAIGITVPAETDHNMRVGLSYLTYHHETSLTSVLP